MFEDRLFVEPLKDASEIDILIGGVVSVVPCPPKDPVVISGLVFVNLIPMGDSSFEDEDCVLASG